MTAPLAPFLTRFSDPPAALLSSQAVSAMPSLPVISLTQDELEARIDAARQEAEALATQRYAAAAAAAAQGHAAATQDAVSAARAEWCTSESERLAAQIDTATNELRGLLSERIAAVLRPWLAETARAHALQAMSDAINRLLTTETDRAIQVCGPEDLVAALRSKRPNAGIDWQIAETVDVAVVANTTRLETRLTAMLPELAMEGRDVG